MDAGDPRSRADDRERIFHQHVKVDADAIGVSRNFNMNRVISSGSRVQDRLALPECIRSAANC